MEHGFGVVSVRLSERYCRSTVDIAMARGSTSKNRQAEASIAA
jgi:hypothetical protein